MFLSQKISPQKHFLLMVAVVILAVGVRLYQLEKADVITDEALLGFRSIGYIDFFVSPYQTTPYEWFSVIPAWAKMSFHDHPPLVFLLQHLFFQLFGDSVFVLRLPSVLFGIGSVFLLYKIGKKLFNDQVGFFSSALLAASSYHVWVSRIGLQESALIFFVLLTVHYFIAALETGRHWQWGIAFGLAILTKYTAFILAPLFIIYLFIFYRWVFLDKRFWLAWVIAFLLFSPVIIYNAALFQERGHFDLQFSYLVGQQVDEWQFLPGKILAGSFGERLLNLFPRLFQGFLLPMTSAFLASLIAAGIYLVARIKHREFDRSLVFILFGLGFILILLLIVGPAFRFAVMVTPLVALLVGWFLYQQKNMVRYSLLGVLLALELLLTYNTVLAHYPVGKQDVTHSRLVWDSYSWGYNELNDYVESLTKNKRPAFSFQTRYEFLEDIRKQALDQAVDRKSQATLIIYDENMHDLATLWIFHRMMIYHGWPVVTAGDFLEAGFDFWQAQGIPDFYFFEIIDDSMLQKPLSERTDDAEVLSQTLSESDSVDFDIIKRPDGRDVFGVHHFSL